MTKRQQTITVHLSKGRVTNPEVLDAVPAEVAAEVRARVAGASPALARCATLPALTWKDEGCTGPLTYYARGAVSMGTLMAFPCGVDVEIRQVEVIDYGWVTRAAAQKAARRVGIPLTTF